MTIRNTWETEFRHLASRQAGLVARFQIRQRGYTPVFWRRARQARAWVDVTPRVIAVKGAPESDTQRALAAVLDTGPGAMLHGPSALAWFGVGHYTLAALHVARPYGLGSRPTSLSKLHRLRDIRPHDLVVVRGVPTASALRAIWTEAARYASNTNELRVELGKTKIGRLLDAAHRAQVLDWESLRQSVTDELRLAKRGRAGTVIMRQLSLERPPGSSPTESRNEEQLEQILADTRRAPLRRQTVVGDGRPLGRADFRDHTLPLLVEVNSLTFHSTPSDRDDDRDRYAQFNDAGFTVCVIWETDLWQRPRHVAETVDRARASARDGNRVVHHSESCPWP